MVDIYKCELHVYCRAAPSRVFFFFVCVGNMLHVFRQVWHRPGPLCAVVEGGQRCRRFALVYLLDADATPQGESPTMLDPH